MARYLTLPSPKGTGILGSTKPLNLESLRRPDQRWDSPQALIRVCPTLFALLTQLPMEGNPPPALSAASPV